MYEFSFCCLLAILMRRKGEEKKGQDFAEMGESREKRSMKQSHTSHPKFNQSSIQFFFLVLFVLFFENHSPALATVQVPNALASARAQTEVQLRKLEIEQPRRMQLHALE